MALDFTNATNNRVEIATSTSIDGGHDPFSLFFVVYRTASTNFRNFFWRASGGSSTRINMFTEGTDGFRFAVGRATSNAQRTTSSNAVPNNALTLVGVTYDSTASPAIHLYTGSLTSSMTEDTGGATNDDGSGASANPTGAIAYVGNLASANAAFPGHISTFMWFDKVLTLAEFQTLQWGNKASVSNRLVYHEYGFNGTGSQADWAGNGDAGTVTGATVTDHAPLALNFGGSNVIPFPTAAAAGRIMSSLANHGGLAGKGGIAGIGGGLAG